ncbi:AAA family ATPase [Roseovarius dicentrarchi]|uniref:AAA family ATPase n=1 Tax=Roseovarius dicentrarchi TaxID=2250573 RepID=UPI00139667D9|nr:AAA family ATPase [Roseovarius dicentrarchi]
MRYKAFRVRNFKGISDTTVEFGGILGASVFPFVGLNESGKTTVLQAIHTFSPDAATSELLSGEKDVGVPFKERVPRHLISTFTGRVSVTATIEANETDLKAIRAKLSGDGLKVEDIPSVLEIERRQDFKSGDFEGSYFTLLTAIKVKTGRQQKFRTPTKDERVMIRDAIYDRTPDIAFFPTFVFDFPSKIYLTDRGGRVNSFYRSVFQDVLDSEGSKYRIENDIVRRIRGEDKRLPWAAFLPVWFSHDDKPKIDHIMDRAGVALTKSVFGRWNKIFGEDTKGKELTVEYSTDEGEVIDENGNAVKTEEHDIFVKFQVKDGTRRFDVKDRSLGFRWFFAFMLFTQFRTARATNKPVLFLFDEPASNLHASAQQRLIESFPEIAIGDHALAYTTHSHYMIEPAWLEQTFIVTNRADAPDDSVIDNVSLDDGSLDINAETYRSFVNRNPNKTSYFQPILDRLQVVPDKFNIDRSSIILEGKSDYYILRYAAKLLEVDDLSFLPGLGAGTLGALVALSTGWNLKYLFVLDSDKAGRRERDKYVRDFALPETSITTLGDYLEHVTVIEDLLDDTARSKIKAELGLDKMPSKAQIKRFFQEKLATNEIDPLGAGFKRNSEKLIQSMKSRLDHV